MKRFNRISKFVASTLVILTALAANSSAAPEGDFDGDGRPDYVAVQKLGGGTQFIVRMTSTNANWTYNFPAAADALITQRRYGKAYPGIVRVESEKKPLRWIISQPGGTLYSFVWEKPGAKITETGDFNGDGVDDLVAVQSINGFYVWKIAINGDTNNVQSFAWGNAGETIHVYNDTVRNVAAAYVLRNVNGTLHWISRTLAGEVRVTQYGLATDIPLGVENFLGGSAKQVALARKTPTGMQIFISSGATSIVRNLGTNDGIPFVAADFSRGAYGIYDRANAFTAITTLVNSVSYVVHGGSGFQFVAPNGTVYPVGVGANGIVSSAGGSGGGGGGGPSINFAGCTKTLNPNDGHGKRITWNPQASKGRKLILPDDYVQDYTVESVKLYNPDGSFHRNMDFFGYEDNRQRWYAYTSAASLPKNMVIVIKLLANEYYGLGTGNHCIPIPDPKRRYD